MPSFTLEAEYSKSNRAACRHCKAKIDKDVVRVGLKAGAADEEQAGGDAESRQSSHMMDAVKWYHFDCLPRAKGKAWFKKHFPGDAATSFTGFEALKPEDQKQVETLLSACRGEIALPGASGESVITPVKEAGGKRKGTEAPGAEPAAKAAKSAFLSQEQADAIAAATATFASKNVAMLGALLAKNGLPKSGRKEELVERAAECKALGVPPTCTLCEKAKLKFSHQSGKFSCPGFFDADDSKFKRCKGPGDEVTTLERVPWQELM